MRKANMRWKLAMGLSAARLATGARPLEGGAASYDCYRRSVAQTLLTLRDPTAGRLAGGGGRRLRRRLPVGV